MEVPDLVIVLTDIYADYISLQSSCVAVAVSNFFLPKARILFFIERPDLLQLRRPQALLSPFITLLCNKSLAVGCFPSDFKRAVVRPLLKKGGLDTSQMKNYRPVSNLSFLSKSLERVVQRRLQEFLDSNNLMPETQSAYRQYHSTETAVTKVYNDLLLAADQGDVSALCLLDLTAAFDTVDHDLLMLRLELQFGEYVTITTLVPI